MTFIFINENPISARLSIAKLQTYFHFKPYIYWTANSYAFFKYKHYILSFSFSFLVKSSNESKLSTQSNKWSFKDVILNILVLQPRHSSTALQAIGLSYIFASSLDKIISFVEHYIFTFIVQFIVLLIVAW